MRESKYQARVIELLERVFPECVVMKIDTGLYQGWPDLLILYKGRWAMLEVKRSGRAAYQPNQEYYIDLFDSMSFCASIYPENEEEILRDLQHTFKPPLRTRFS